MIDDIEALYRQYSKDVYRFAVYLSGDRSLAEDIAAETFVRVWTTPNVIEMGTVKGYLFAIARNLYLKGLRHASSHVAYDPESPLTEVAAAHDLEHLSLQKESLERVMQQLQQLAEVDRAALLMRAFDEMSYDEISRVLSLPIASIKVKVHRARLRLAKVR